MRGRLRSTAGALAACVIGAMACSERPLPHREPPDAGDAGDAGDAPPSVDAGVEQPHEAGLPPGVVDWGVPIGTQPAPAAAGATVVKAVVASDDGGAIVA